MMDKTLGSGWLFRKRSQFYPVFKQYYAAIKEAGTVERISAQYYNIDIGYKKDQLCSNHEGKPIGMKKAYSLFAIVILGLGLSMVVLM